MPLKLSVARSEYRLVVLIAPDTSSIGPHNGGRREVTMPVARSLETVRGSESDDTLVAVDRFIQATRDSGYRGTPSAVAELVDNALQAGASRVVITVEQDP